MKLIRVLSVILLVTFLSALCLVNVKPAFAAAAENTWEIKTPLPQAVEGGKAAVVGGSIYMIGSSFNYQYDTVTDTWTAKEPMPTPRQWFGIAVCQNKIFTIGGYNFNNGVPIYSYAVNEVYDPSTDTWQTKQPMPTGREKLAASVIGNQIYLIGGRTGDHKEVALNEVYNVDNDSWTTKEPMPYPQTIDASAVSGGKIYIMGVSGNQIYDPLNNSWSLGAPMLAYHVGAVAAATTGANALRRVYVFGGFGPNFRFLEDVVQVYDPENNNWTYGMPMPTARAALTAAVLDDKIYTIGGAVRRENEVYTPFGYGTLDPAYVLEHYPPKISFLSPLNQTYNETDVSLLFNVDKTVNWMGYSLDGQQNVTITGNITLIGLSSGSHSVTVYANDTYGNMGASEAVAFTIPETFPVATAFAASGVITAVFVGAGIVLYYKRRRRSQLFS